MKTHQDLDIWKRSIEFVSLIYSIKKDFPSDEKYGLTSQIRRSAVSIPSNISEGAARNTAKDFNHFLAITLGSLSELETQIIISKTLGFINDKDFELLNAELVIVRKMTLVSKNHLISNITHYLNKPISL